MSKKLFFFSIILGTLLVLLPKGASAGFGPEPSIVIDVVYNQQSISDIFFSAEMLGCVSQYKYEKYLIPQLRINEYDSSKNCYWSPDTLVWRRECFNSSCHFGHMSPSEFKLAVFVPSINKVFITNKIYRTNFKNHYRAELFSDGSAKISEITPILSSDRVSSFAKIFSITIVLELLVSLIFLSARNLPKKILVYILLVNVISLPIIWFLFPLIKLPILAIIVMLEIFAVLFETYFVYILNKQIISFKQSLTLNVLNNLVSLFIGGFIYAFLEISGI